MSQNTCARCFGKCTSNSAVCRPLRRRRSSSRWPTTAWRKRSTGQKSPLRQSAKPTSREGTLCRSSHQVNTGYYCIQPLSSVFIHVIKEMTCVMSTNDRLGKPRGHRHRPPGPNYVLDRLHEGSHRGCLSGRVHASHHHRLRSRQPSRYRH